MNLELRLKVLVGSVIALGVHVLGCSVVESDFLMAPDWLMQLILYCASRWSSNLGLLMRCENVVFLLLFYFELEVLGLIEQVLIGIRYDLILLILIQKVDFLHLIKVPLKVLVDSNLLLYILMAVLLNHWNWKCPLTSMFSEQRFLINLIQQIQFRQPLLIELLQVGYNSLSLRLHIWTYWLALSIVREISVIWLARDISDEHPLLLFMFSHLHLNLLIVGILPLFSQLIISLFVKLHLKHVLIFVGHIWWIMILNYCVAFWGLFDVDALSGVLLWDYHFDWVN